jgi:hypothetical protein
MRTLNDHQDFAARLLDIEFYTGPSQRVLSRMRCSVSQLIVVVGGVYKATVDTANGRSGYRNWPGAWGWSRVAGAVGVSSASKLSVLLTRHAGASARDIQCAARSKPAKRK